MEVTAALKQSPSSLKRHGSRRTAKMATEDLIEGGSGKPLKAPAVTLICSVPCFQKLIRTSSRGLSLAPMIPHAKEISDISTATQNKLKGWFWDDFITCFPPRPAPPEPRLWAYFSRFLSNPIKDESRGAVTAKHVPAEAKKSLQTD